MATQLKAYSVLTKDSNSLLLLQLFAERFLYNVVRNNVLALEPGNHLRTISGTFTVTHRENVALPGSPYPLIR